MRSSMLHLIQFHRYAAAILFIILKIPSKRLFFCVWIWRHQLIQKANLPNVSRNILKILFFFVNKTFLDQLFCFVCKIMGFVNINRYQFPSQ